jgi:large subunit ribosomal protein L4
VAKESSQDAPKLPPVSIPVVNRQGEQVGKVEIDPAEFGGKINRQLLHEACLMFQANQRAGTHSTLRRGEVAGSTKKVFRQKGTGNARIGTKRTNKRRGGGTAKGPKPRDYEYHLPKKAVRAATRMAILSKFLDKEAVIIDDLKITEVKTKPVAEVIRALTKKLVPAPAAPDPAPEGEKPRRKKKAASTWLIGTDGIDRNLHLSARNLPDVRVMPAAELNAYTVLRQKRLVLTRPALEALRKGPPVAAK